jgi:predicted RNase H-like HicB family nuclease
MFRLLLAPKLLEPCECEPRLAGKEKRRISCRPRLARKETLPRRGNECLAGKAEPKPRGSEVYPARSARREKAFGPSRQGSTTSATARGACGEGSETSATADGASSGRLCPSNGSRRHSPWFSFPVRTAGSLRNAQCPLRQARPSYSPRGGSTERLRQMVRASCRLISTCRSAAYRAKPPKSAEFTGDDGPLEWHAEGWKDVAKAECGDPGWRTFREPSLLPAGRIPATMLLSFIMTTLPVVLRPGEDGWFVAECPVLPGCVSQGKTRDEALANIREAIALCLEAGDVPKGELVDVTVAA